MDLTDARKRDRMSIKLKNEAYVSEILEVYSMIQRAKTVYIVCLLHTIFVSVFVQ